MDNGLDGARLEIAGVASSAAFQTPFFENSGMTGTSRSFQSGLRIAFSLSFGAAVALGLARFAYALVLPAMREDLHWSYTQSGLMNTANAVGYFLGAILAAPLQARGARRSFTLSLCATGLVLIASGFSSDLVWLLAMRLLAGVGGGITYVSGGVLVSNAVAGQRGASLLSSIYFCGAWLGIVASGLALPGALEAGLSWQGAWVALGLAALACFVPAALTAARLPEPPPRPATEAARASLGVMLPGLIAYFCFALGYIAYMTFAIAFVRQNGHGTLEVSLFWGVLGLAGGLSPFVWGRLIERARGGEAIAGVMIALFVGAALPLVSSQSAALFVSGALFGGSFLAVVSSVAALSRRALPAHAWGGAISALTAVFGAGQILGPLISGALSDALGGLGSSLAWSAGVILLGAIVALFQPRLEPKIPS